MRNKISNILVFIEALGEHLIGDDRIGYSVVAWSVGVGCGFLLGEYVI